MAISFEELEGSPRIQIREEGTLAQRVFRIAWDDWPQFARQLLGRYKVIGGTFTFVEPLQFPGMENLIVSDLEIQPFEPSCPDGANVGTLRSGTNRYPQGGAQVTATYSTRFDSDNQPRTKMPTVQFGTYLTYRADLGVEYQSVPARHWRWTDPPDNSPLAGDIHPGLLLPHGSFQLIWHRVALPPWEVVRQLRGKVNQAEFLGSPAETVLFLGAKAVREFQFLEDGGFWRMEYHFLESAKELSDGTQVGWNHFHKETAVDGEHWVGIEDEEGEPPYASSDFASLFLFG